MTDKIEQIQYDELVKYIHIPYLGSPETQGIEDRIVVCESKVDGAQFRARYVPESDSMIYGSRRQILSNDISSKQWPAISEFNTAFETHKESLIPNVIYYAESMQRHTIHYPDSIHGAIGYDILDLDTMTFWDWKLSKKAFESIGIPFIHVHFEKQMNEISQEDITKLYSECKVYVDSGDEGIVFKNYTHTNRFGRPLFAKVVCPIFKEQNKKVFGGGSPPKPKSHEIDIVDTYFTPHRFTKAINVLKQEGHIIDMSLMPTLYRYIGDDILSEHILEIRAYGSINFKMMDKLIANRCAVLLSHRLRTEL